MIKEDGRKKMEKELMEWRLICVNERNNLLFE